MYSLVVYNNKNHEKIIIDRSKFDKLYKIDCLTARFKDKEEFVKFLISSELIKEEDVRIYIHYKYKGDKYLPIIYNNIDLLFYIVQTDRNKLEESVDFNYIIEFYTSYYYIILPIIIMVSLAYILIQRKKNDLF